MKLTLSALLLVVGTLFCCAQEDTTGVPFVSYWSVGDSYNFRVTKIQKKWKKGVLTKNDSSSYVANFKVLDSTENSYTIQWKYSNNLKDFNVPLEFYGRFSKYKMTEVIYTTNELGEFIGVKNWREIASIMKKLSAELMEVLAEEKGTDKKQLKKIMKSLLKIYESKEGIEQLVLKELYFIHFPFGVEFSKTETLYYEEEIPNMFGGDPIKGDSKIYVSELDEEDDYCVLIKEMQLNPEDMKEAMLDVLKMMKSTNPEMVAIMKTAKIDTKDHHKYEYYYYPGIPIHVEAKRSTVIEIQGEKAEKIEITRIEWVE